MAIKRKFSAKLAKDVRRLHPGYFSLVMATGIISIAAYNLRLDKIAYTLFGINIAFYGVLCSLTLGRLAFFPKTLLKDFSSHKLGPTFFTLPAGSCVLGSQVLLFSDFLSGGLILWGIGFISWLIIMYGFFYAAAVIHPKPTLGEGLTGAWSLPVVATFSISILSAQLAVRLPMETELLLLVALAMFSLGQALYMFIISLMFYRFFFFPFTPRALAAPYWINMGVEAIATLAGAKLVLHASDWPFLEGVLPFLKGMTLFFWAASNWWFPLLLLLGFWRHVVRRIPLLHYNMEYWSMVFPLGMYAASTFRLAEVMGIELFKLVTVFFATVAVCVWLLTFTGLCHRLVRRYANIL